MVHRISRDELRLRLENGESTVIVEALPPRYFAQAHLPGALNLPHDQVAEKAPTLLPDKDATIVVYCANTPCQNSRIASEALARLGYRDVHEYVEGKEDWIAAGLPTEAAAGVAA